MRDLGGEKRHDCPVRRERGIGAAMHALEIGLCDVGLDWAWVMHGSSFSTNAVTFLAASC